MTETLGKTEQQITNISIIQKLNSTVIVFATGEGNKVAVTLAVDKAEQLATRLQHTAIAYRVLQTLSRVNPPSTSEPQSVIQTSNTQETAEETQEPQETTARKTENEEVAVETEATDTPNLPLGSPPPSGVGGEREISKK